jgi:putative ABC transport system substrate-binding protein
VAIWFATILAIQVSLSVAAPSVQLIPKIGYLLARGPDPGIDNAFFDGMRDLGYVEGKNVIFERRFAHGVFEQLPQFVAELVALRVHVIVAAPFPAALAAKRGTSSVPIVMLTGGDPVKAGLVASLARPGGNVTGVSNQAGDVMPKMLELLREMVPATKRVAVLMNPENPMHEPFRKELDATAQVLRTELIYLPAAEANDFEGAFREAARRGAGGLIIPQDPVFFNQRGLLIALAARQRMPMMAPFREFPMAGGLASYGRNLVDGFRRMAVYVDRILRGADPSALPIEQPTTFELVVNLKTAAALELDVPPSLLVRADEVIR